MIIETGPVDDGTHPESVWHRFGATPEEIAAYNMKYPTPVYKVGTTLEITQGWYHASGIKFWQIVERTGNTVRLQGLEARIVSSNDFHAFRWVDPPDYCGRNFSTIPRDDQFHMDHWVLPGDPAAIFIKRELSVSVTGTEHGISRSPETGDWMSTLPPNITWEPTLISYRQGLI